MSDKVILESGIVESGPVVYFTFNNDDGEPYDVVAGAHAVINTISPWSNAKTAMNEIGVTTQREGTFPGSAAVGNYTILIRRQANPSTPAVSDEVVARYRYYWNGTDLLDSLEAGGQAISPTFVESQWIWKFQAQDQMTAGNVINEVVGFDGLLGMTFDRILSPNVVIRDSRLVTVYPTDAGTGQDLDVGLLMLSPNKRVIYIPTVIYDEGTYTVVVEATTTDSQKVTRRGVLSVQTTTNN